MNKSVIAFDDLVNAIPSTLNEASVAATFCLDTFVVELSILDSPDPVGVSVAVILSEFFFRSVN